jgi:hypothetical protein
MKSIPASIACALELCAHSGDERAGFELPFRRGRLGAVLLPSGGDVALDPASDERAKIGLRAIARIGRCFIRVLPEIGFYGIEQWRKLRLIARRVGQRVRHDDLMGAIDGSAGPCCRRRSRRRPASRPPWLWLQIPARPLSWEAKTAVLSPVRNYPGFSPRASNCWLHSAGASRSRSTPMPRGKRPSTAARTRSGARNASESVMLT